MKTKNDLRRGTGLGFLITTPLGCGQPQIQGKLSDMLFQDQRLENGILGSAKKEQNTGRVRETQNAQLQGIKYGQRPVL